MSAVWIRTGGIGRSGRCVDYERWKERGVREVEGMGVGTGKCCADRTRGRGEGGREGTGAATCECCED